MRNVMKNSELEADYLQHGYVIVPMFSKEEIEELRKFFFHYSAPLSQSVGKRDNTYELSFFDSDTERKKFIFQKLDELLRDKWALYLDNYEPVVLNMFSKEKDKGEVPVHQNWTFVDETKYRSVSLWIPLQDVSHENGTLEMVPGTHDNFHLFRGPNVPWIFENITTQIKEKFMVPLNLIAGQVAILDDSILHYSSENKTDQPRLAIQAILKPKEASAITYYFDAAAGELEVFEADSDYFLNIDVTKRPAQLKKTGSIPYRHRPIAEADLVNFIQRHEESVHK